MILKKISPKNRRKNGVFDSKPSYVHKLCTNVIITLVFEKKPIFSPKIGKNRKNK
jgi:hypothetical protein